MVGPAESALVVKTAQNDDNHCQQDASHDAHHYQHCLKQEIIPYTQEIPMSPNFIPNIANYHS